MGVKRGRGRAWAETRTLLDYAGHRLTSYNVSLTSLAGHGPKHESRHRRLIIAWIGPRGPVLYNCCQRHHHPPESSQAEAANHSASNLSLTLGGGTEPKPGRPVRESQIFWLFQLSWGYNSAEFPFVKLSVKNKNRLDWLSNQGERSQCVLLFAYTWRENSWIHTFPKGISAMWNATSLVEDLNSCRRIHFQRR